LERDANTRVAVDFTTGCQAFSARYGHSLCTVLDLAAMKRIARPQKDGCGGQGIILYVTGTAIANVTDDDFFFAHDIPPCC
jgi:hypothetical protein